MIVKGRLAVAFLMALLLSACGGGGGDGTGFLPNSSPPEVTITTPDLPVVTQLPYAAILEASGGQGGYTWSLLSDGGTGYTLDSEGVLRSGGPIVEGTYGLTFRVEDGRGVAAERSLTLVVQVAPFNITTTALPQGEQQVPYSTVLEATGGTTPYSWQLIDDGGTGLTITAAGVLSGVGPRQGGTYGLTVLAEDAAGATARRSLVLEITGEAQPLAVATDALPATPENERYAAVVTATGGSGNYDWRLLSSGNSGLSLSDEGVLSGVAPDAGVYGLTFEVNDGVERASRSLTLTVTASDTPLQIESTDLPSGVAGVAYAGVVTAVGGTGDYSFALVDGGNSGLTLSSNGVLRGVPFVSGTFGVTVRVNDGRDTVVRSFLVEIEPAPSIDVPEPEALTIATDSLPSTAPGERYAAVLNATGGSGSYTWRISGANLTGLALSAGGVLSGTAPAAGTYGLTFVVEDGTSTATRSLTLSVVGDGPSALTITTTALPNPQTGIQYAAVLSATGGDGNYTWSLPDGGAGTGLSINTAGVLSGVPGLPGTYGLTISVTDGDATVDTQSFSITIEGATSAPLEVATTTLPAATAGTIYAATLIASGGTGDYSWTLDDDGGSGLTLDSSGSLRGTAPVEGVYALDVSVSDSVDVAGASITLTVSGSSLAILTTAIPSVITGADYVAVLEASGGTGPYTWSLVTDGGTGFGIDSNGILSGTAPAVGDYGVTIRVTDGEGATAIQSYVLEVNAATVGEPEPLLITVTTLPAAVEGTRYAATLLASGGSGQYTWTPDDDGGTGLLLDSRGSLRGTAPPIGTYALNVTVEDGAGASTSASLTLQVNGTGLQVSTATLPPARASVAYVAILEATGGSGVYAWSLVAPPAGFSLSPNGILSVPAPATGSFGVTVQVTDDVGATAVRSYTFSVDAPADAQPLVITTTGLPIAQPGASYATTLEATGGIVGYTWSLISDGGSGLLLDADGVLSGSAPSTGLYGLTFEVEDSVGATTRQSFVLEVSSAGPSLLAIETDSLPAQEEGQPYLAILNAVGGDFASYVWSVVNDGGTGLAFRPGTNILEGAATPAAGTYGVTIQVVDGVSAAVRSYLLTIGSSDVVDPLTITTTGLPPAGTDTRYVTVLEATGGSGAYSWTPLTPGGTDGGSGLTLSTDGVLEGTVGTEGAYAITAEVSDGVTTVSQSLVLSVTELDPDGADLALSIRTTTLTPALEGSPYAAVLEADGGVRDYTWALLDAGGTGLALDSLSAGVISVAAAPPAGTYGITVSVTDANGVARSRSLTLTVTLP